MSAKAQVAALIARAKEGARIELLRRRNDDEGYTCFTVGHGGGCGDTCPVREAGDCEHGNWEAAKAEICSTCGGTGEVDMTLGGEWFSNPHEPCPDCTNRHSTGQAIGQGGEG